MTLLQQAGRSAAGWPAHSHTCTGLAASLLPAAAVLQQGIFGPFNLAELLLAHVCMQPLFVNSQSCLKSLQNRTSI